jgi:hypothetical protein
MTDKTAAELQADERAAAIARGDIIEGDEDNESRQADTTDETDAGDGGDIEGGDADVDTDAAAADAAAEEGDEGGDGDDSEGAGTEVKDKGIMIPKARFDEAQKKARQREADLQERLAKVEKSHAVKTSDTDITAMEAEIEKLADKYEDHLMDGELEKARVIRRDMTTRNRRLTEMRLVQQSQQTGNAAVEQIRYEAKLANLESRYPAINPDSADYNEAVIAEVAELKAAFEARGLVSTAALEKAVHYALRDDTATTEDPDIKRSQLAHKQRKKNADAVRKSPPDISKAGRDSDKGGKGDGLPDVSKMSHAQFDKLSETELAKLRGDLL